MNLTRHFVISRFICQKKEIKIDPWTTGRGSRTNAFHQFHNETLITDPPRFTDLEIVDLFQTQT